MSARRFTLVPQLETYPTIVRLAQTVPGKLAILAALALGLWLHHRPWWAEMTAILAAVTFLPAHRRWVIAIATMYWLFRHTTFPWEMARMFSVRNGVATQIDWRLLRPAAILSALGFCVAFNVALKRTPRPAILRRPILLLLTFFLTLAVIATGTSLDPIARVLIFAFLVVLGRYLWFLAYSALYPEPTRSSLLVVGQYLPFWFGSNVTANPIPKGGGYLDKIEAKTPEELAICQLKAVKLLVWAGLLVMLHKLIKDLSDGKANGPLSRLGISFDLDLPIAPAILRDSAAGIAHPLVTTWLSLVADFADDMLVLAIWGHVLVACARASGFRALRNTWRPLESATIADFWNRYFYYFKEVLVDVFFYPTYFRYFKAHPRLRRFAATLAAATFGNFLFHYLRDLEHMAHLGPWKALLSMHAYMAYCLVLGIAIGVSQLRKRPNLAAEHWIRRRVWRPALVLGFFCLLKVLEIPGPGSLSDRLRFLVSLTGLHA
ncbi:MAG TPA: hypothetical protein VK843_06885 [Planctomycetota bacterium]|nr:hypothetical protein [Planctomycetota bacterium]